MLEQIIARSNQIDLYKYYINGISKKSRNEGLTIDATL